MTDNPVVNTISGQTMFNNMSMMNGHCENKHATRICDVAAIPFHSINAYDESKRDRPLDVDAVNLLADDIRMRGLLQPIGLRATKGRNKGPFDLLWGAHRLAAFIKIFNEDTEHKFANGCIPSVIFPPDMSDVEVEQAILVENLLRKELSATERGVSELKYARLLKASGAVVSASEKKAAAGKKGGKIGGGHNKKGGKASTSDDVTGACSDPATDTVLMRLAKLSPASPHSDKAHGSIDAVKRRFEQVKKLSGLGDLNGVTLENATEEQLNEIFKAASANLPKLRKESVKRKSDATLRADPRRKLEPDEKITEHLLKMAEQHGWSVVQKAVQEAWRIAEAPDGRVVFNTSNGPAADGPKERPRPALVKSA